MCLDPLSTSAQKIVPVLKHLRDHLNARVDLVLNPETKISDLPLKSYYAYSLPEITSSLMQFPQAPKAWFPRLPSRRVLTLNIAVPEAWLVEVGTRRLWNALSNPTFHIINEFHR